jgi:hypothetical protein
MLLPTQGIKVNTITNAPCLQDAMVLHEEAEKGTLTGKIVWWMP